MKTYLDFNIEKIDFKGEQSLRGKNYPKTLNKIKNPPKQIYYRGTWNKDIFRRTIAIVGARRMTNYGRQVVDQFVSEFVANGITTISGFMYGIDTEVHRKTMEYGGKTISVFGNGLDYVYPAENDKLYSEILNNGGLVISEYDKNMKAQLWTYPARNRIVAGLATIGILVIEADIESGSLVTANLAVLQKKKVWAIPGPITSKVSRGTNKLIKDGLAKMAITPSDILGKGIEILQEILPEMNGIETEIYMKLQSESLSIDEIAVLINKSIIEVTSALTMMGLKGVVVDVGGKFYISKG